MKVTVKGPGKLEETLQEIVKKYSMKWLILFYLTYFCLIIIETNTQLF